MAKYTVIGVEPRVYRATEKNPSGSRAMELHLVGKSAKVYGKKASSITIFDSTACFNSIASFFSVPQELIGFNVSVDYDSKGYLEDFELLDKPVKPKQLESSDEKK